MEMINRRIPVTQIQRFSTLDGSGIRTTVFLKRCPLKCKWCHNPETQSPDLQIYYISQNCINCGCCAAACKNKAHYMTENIKSHAREHHFDVQKCSGCLQCVDVCPAFAIEGAGKFMTAKEIVHETMKDKAFYGDTGGITLSGGEPLFYAKDCLEILQLAKEKGISTAIETSGYFDPSYIEELVERVDYFLWDFKDADNVRHMENTGVSNKKILDNLFLVASNKKTKNIILRCIMIKGINMEESNYQKIKEICSLLRTRITLEIFPYHAYGGSKSLQLGYENNGRKDWVPSFEDMEKARKRSMPAFLIS